jgi:Tol biopolymer transport system component
MSSASRVFAVLCASVLATILALPGTAFGHRHGGDANGRIIWSQAGETSVRIVSANPDGSHFRLLSDPPPDFFDIDPVPSPNGRRILFERDDSDGNAEIVLMRADGSRERTLDTHCADPCADDINPTWAPDGRHVVFTRVVGPFDQPNDSARSAVLWVEDLHGEHLRRLSQRGIDGVYEDYHAHFTPDGRTITFTRVRNEPFNSAEFAMDANHRHVRQLTPWEIDADIYGLSQARSGRTEGVLAFETFGHGAPDGESSNVATVPSDCPNLASCTARIRYLTDNGAGPGASYNPAWSPDGSRIVFAESVDDATTPADLWTMRPNGSHRRRFTNTPDTHDFRPSWARALPR